VPRNPEIEAKRKLKAALRVEDRAVVMKQRATAQRHTAMIDAVNAGISRYEVGKLCRGITGSAVSQIDGMPKGVNKNPKAKPAKKVRAKVTKAPTRKKVGA
jgi:hypothetical protein